MDHLSKKTGNRIGFIIVLVFLLSVVSIFWRNYLQVQEATKIVKQAYPSFALNESVNDSVTRVDHPYDSLVHRNNDLPHSAQIQLFGVGKRTVYVLRPSSGPFLSDVLVPGARIVKNGGSDSILVVSPNLIKHYYRLYDFDGYPLKGKTQ